MSMARNSTIMSKKTPQNNKTTSMLIIRIISRRSAMKTLQ
jgi:hypothetical protein